MDLPWMFAIIAGCFALGVAIVLVMCGIFHMDETVDMGMIISLVGLLVALLCRRNQNPHSRLHFAVLMGQTRRGFLLTDSLILLLEGALALAAIWAGGHLEIALYRAVFPAANATEFVLAVFQWRVVLVALLVMLVGNLVFTAVMNRFGIKGFLILWLPLCLVNMLVGPSLTAARMGRDTVIARLGRALIWIIDNLSGVPWQLLLGGVLAALTVGSLLMLRRCEVKL